MKVVVRSSLDRTGEGISASFARHRAVLIFSRFAPLIRRIRVHIGSDHGGEDTLCRVAVNRRQGQALVCSALDPDAQKAISLALDKALRLLLRERAVMQLRGLHVRTIARGDRR